MFSGAIVERDDVLKDGAASLLMGRKAFTRGTFALECSEKTFHHRIIPAIAFPAHADLNIMGIEKALIGFAGILTPPVRVVEEPNGWLALGQCHGKRPLNQLLIKGRMHGEANDTPRKEIEDDGQVQPAGRRWDIGHVSHPFLNSVAQPRTGDPAHSEPLERTDWLWS